MDEITIRKASPKDIDSISTIKLSGWKNSYPQIVDKQYLDSLTIRKIKENISAVSFYKKLGGNIQGERQMSIGNN